jgi:hypothetical protein
MAQVPCEHIDDFKSSESSSFFRLLAKHGRMNLLPSPKIQDLQYEQSLDRPQRYIVLCNTSSRLAILIYAALKRIMDSGGMELDIIVNPKVTEDGQSVIQVRSCS